MTTIMKKITLAVIALTVTFSVWATTLEQAKQQGLVGEMSNGYLGIVVPSPDAKSLVARVNEKRKALYQKLAKKNNLTMAQVTALAGEKAIAKTKPGNLIKDSSGNWVKK